MFNYFFKILPAIPEIILSISTLISLVLGTFLKKKSKRFTLGISITFLIALSFYFLVIGGYEQFFWNGMFVNRHFSVYAKCCLYILSAISIFCLFSFSDSYGLKKFEWLIIAMFAVIGGSVAISSNHFLTLFIGLEITNLSQYLMVASNNRIKNGEASIKFFIMGVVGTLFLLFGTGLIYGFTGTCMFNSLFHFFESNVYNISNSGAVIGMFFVIIGLCFKLPVAPFHSWAPDVYQSAPLPVVLFIGTIPKLISIFSLMHMLTYPFYGMFSYWRYLFMGFALLSLVWGAFAALKQKNIFRIFAYSTVMNMGFLLVGTAMGGDIGLKSSIVYGIFYVLTMIGIFSLLILFERKFHKISNVEDLSGIMSHSPMLGVLFVLLIFSIAGIPPMPGFFAKFYIIISALSRSAYYVAVIALLMTVVSTAYYLNILKFFVFGVNNLKDNNLSILKKYAVKIIVVFILICLLLMNIFPVKMLETAHEMVVSALFG